MPQVPFSPGAIASTSEAEIAEFKLTKNLARPGQLKTVSVASINRLARRRSFGRIEANSKTGMVGRTKRKASLAGGAILTQVRSQIKFFLNAAPVAPPTGRISLQRLDALTDPKFVGPRLGGSRLIKNDLIPIFFAIRGEKTNGLTARFVARQLGVAEGVTPLSIEKAAPSNIKQTWAVIDPQTKVEQITGNFSIEPGDTAGFPEGEVELAYQFVMTDGLGRHYTIERGSFTVFTVL